MKLTVQNYNCKCLIWSSLENPHYYLLNQVACWTASKIVKELASRGGHPRNLFSFGRTIAAFQATGEIGMVSCLSVLLQTAFCFDK